jgi:hypothetical protein
MIALLVRALVSLRREQRLASIMTELDRPVSCSLCISSDDKHRSL